MLGIGAKRVCHWRHAEQGWGLLSVKAFYYPIKLVVTNKLLL